jgi:hypothetical protein
MVKMESSFSIERVSEINSKALLADGFDEAILGMCIQFGQEPVVAYNYNKCIEILKNRDDMSNDEAIEYMEYNVIGAYMGVNSPVFITK